MPRTLPNLTNVPPGGWEYEIPETKKVLTGSNLPELKLKIQAQYVGAGYDVPSDLDLKIEAYMCALDRMRDYCEQRQTSIFDTVAKSLSSSGNLYHTFHAAVQCMRTMISHIGGTGEKITQEVAESRASDCAGCPKNSSVAGCLNCNKGVVGQLIGKIVGSRVTKRDGELLFCQVCHCATRSKIWTKHEAIWKHMPEGQKKALPETCWIISESKGAS